MANLFTEEFARAVHQLRLIARQVPAGGRHADQRSRTLGSGMEFRDFRSYVPGDDLRRVDWNLYRRSGRVFLRLFEETEDLPVYILLDASDSMFFETPARADPARQMAAVLASVALNQLDRVGIYPFGADLGQALPAVGGKQSFHRLLSYLERLGPLGPTDMARSIRRFSGMRIRGGLVVIVSDFFDPAGIDAVIEALRSLRHRLVLIQVVRPADESPKLSGELLLRDCESSRGVEVTVTPRILDRYREAYRSFNDRLMDFVARRRAVHMRLNADVPVLEQLGDLFVGGVLAT
jgi:uncharacterized protein (DUF58 family)